MKPGDKVTYFRFKYGHHYTKQYPATLIKLGKHRHTIQLEDGKIMYVTPDNLQLIKHQELNK